MTFTRQLSGILSTLGQNVGCGSVAANAIGGRTFSPRSRAVAESVITRNVIEKLKSELLAIEMWNTFKGNLHNLGRVRCSQSAKDS